jgi:hypothetical protein
LIHSTRIAVSGGTTAGAYGTAVDLELDNYAKQLIALMVIGVDATVTAAEGSVSQLRVTSKDLGYADQVFPIGPIQTSGPATNHSGYSSILEIIPLDWPTTGKETLNIDIAPQGASTAAKLFEVAALWSDELGPPDDWIRRFPRPVPFRGGDMVGAQQLTTVRTALTAIKTPNWAKEIVAVKGQITKTGAITAGEECLGYFDLTTTLKGTAPQQYPVVFAQGATLGTPVGTGQQAIATPWIPTHIPLGDAQGRVQQETITPYINLRTAITTDARVSFAIAWR